MAISRYNKTRGFTLIEVLVAMAILSIALIAIFRNTNVTIKNAQYIQDKNIAHWVAINVMIRAEVGLINIPTAGNMMSGEETMLGQTFVWQLSSNNVQDLPMLQLQVRILNQKKESIDTIESFIQKPSNMQ